MSEFIMKMLGLNGYLTGGKAMADRLAKSGVKDISVVGRGAVIVHTENSGKMSGYRKVAKKFVEQDAKIVAASGKDSDGS